MYVGDKKQRYEAFRDKYVSLSKVVHLHNKLILGRRRKEEARRVAAEGKAAAGELDGVVVDPTLELLGNGGKASPTAGVKALALQDVIDSHAKPMSAAGLRFSNAIKSVVVGVTMKRAFGGKHAAAVEEPKSKEEEVEYEEEEEDHPLTKEEQELYAKNHHVMHSIHKQNVLTREELAARAGVNEDDTYHQVGEGANMRMEKVVVPKRGRKQANEVPTLGVLYQNELEVVHYR